MPLRPFPHPYRVGIDICHVPRIARFLDTAEKKNHPTQRLHRFLQRIFTDHEEAGFWRRFVTNRSTFTFDPVKKHLAGRWAAKEAIIKASPCRLSFNQILIATSQDRKPYGVVLDTGLQRKYSSHAIFESTIPETDAIDPLHALENPESHQNRPLDLPLIEDINGQIIPLSISHDGDYAVAMALCPKINERNRSSSHVLFRDLLSREA